MVSIAFYYPHFKIFFSLSFENLGSFSQNFSLGKKKAPDVFLLVLGCCWLKEQFGFHGTGR